MKEIICPHCHNPTYDEEALLCHFCGESLERAGNGLLSNLRYGNNRILWLTIGGITIAALVLLFSL